MKHLQPLKRPLAFILACVLCISTLNISSFATESVNIYRRLNIFEGRNFTVFGKAHNSMGYYQEELEGGAQPTFCLEPGKRMPNGEAATFEMYTATGDETIPGVGSSDKFVPITLAYEWIQTSDNLRDTVRYAVVQTYIWGCIAGYSEDWTAQEEAQRTLAEVLGNNRVMAEYEDMKAAVEAGLEEYNGSSSSGLPDWNGSKQKMILENGSYTLTLDISACPQLKNAVWSFPDSNWSYQILGSEIKFLYQGADEPKGEIRSSELTGVGNNTKFYAYIFTPGTGSTYQRQVGRFANEEIPLQAYFYVNSSEIPSGTVEFETYRHSETFDTNYNIDLEKYCAETNQRLEGTSFNIWEDFDAAQLSGHNYEEGSPDGSSGRLYDNAFSPMPSGLHICDTVTTDGNGFAAHRDSRSYEYSKTYCLGHPAPEWVEVPEAEYDEETGECTNEGEIEAAEAENERLMELWASQQEMCEDTCDFHVGNTDEENREADYTAQDEMLEDRDKTYENFIELEYSYHLEEKTARTGYILHGSHGDDPEIETVIISSAQAGGNAHKSTSRLSAADEASAAPAAAGPQGNEMMRNLAFRVAARRLCLDDLRSVTYAQIKNIVFDSFDATPGEAGHSLATDSEAVYDSDEEEFADEEDTVLEGRYTYSYSDIEAPKVAQAATGSTALFAAPRPEEDVDINDSFPDFMDDDLDGMETGAYGNAGDILYTFKVWDHRTEGEIHINKRDLELYETDPDGSYGRTQGDASLEGAVYGLFAAQDLVHPDGKSKVIYSQNDLVAVAATDKNGDASFLAYTEKPGTRLDADGNVLAPDAAAGAGNLYNGSSITSSDLGFGTVNYPDYAAENGDPWIGRPLLLGSYYIMELSRSEGYELSVNGIAATETNKDVTGITTVQEAGQVSVSLGLSDNNDMDADGSWNDFTVSNYKTVNGYDVAVSGYPKNTKFYKMSVESVEETIQTVTGSTLAPKKDESGNPVYQKAKGGEYKTDADGNPIVKEAADPAKPQAETVKYRFRASGYPNGTVEPADPLKWQEPVGDYDYLADEVNGMLAGAGYKPAGDAAGSPWVNIELTGSVNAEAGTEIFDWFTAHNAWDSAAVQSIFEDGGTVYARLYYDYSKASEDYPAFYDALNRTLYIRKEMTVDGGAPDSHYWIGYDKGEFSLGGSAASVKLKREIPADAAVTFGEEFESLIIGIYQPSYETYASGETLLGPDGQPVPVMERVYTYADYTQSVDQEIQEAVAAAYDQKTGCYTIHVENETDWDGVTMPEYTRYRAVTAQTAIEHDGETMYYNRYLTEVAGAGVSAYAAMPEFNAGSYIVSQVLVYPGQFTVFQDGGTGGKPLQVLERVIKQSIRITKDISQASYDDVNTYGSVHNDPLTALLGLFGGGASSQGTKLLSQFKFKAYLKKDLEAICIDDAGTQLLERGADGGYNYRKFFDALYAADRRRGENVDYVTERFAVEYYDVVGYKAAVLAASPGLNSDIAYQQAMEQAENEAGAYLDMFAGLDEKLAIAWDSDAGGGSDGDKTTLQCNTKNGKDDYYNSSIMLPYGTYVIAEQAAAEVDRELANRHYSADYPKEIVLPFAPDISADENTGEENVNSDFGNPYYFYQAADTPEDLIRKYKIRFNEETHIIQAHREDGDFVIYKYGLEPDTEPGTVRNALISRSENAGMMDGVVYSGNETGSGQMEIRDGVSTMIGVNTAIDGKYAAMLVPWTILEPAADRINPDTGNVETLVPSGSGKDFNFVAYAAEDFENKYYSSKLRIEKLDAQTGENIIHSGALFKIYAAKREVGKTGTNAASGSGKVLFGEAVDINGTPVVDNAGNKVLYPRVGRSNGSAEDLPIRLDKDGVPIYDESQLIMQEDTDGNEVGIFKAYSTVREVADGGQIRKETVGYIETYKPLGAGAYVLTEVQAPEGYARSRPVAFEVYADDVNYYEDKRSTDGTTDGWERVPAMQYQYAVPVTGGTNKFQTETVSQIKVRDYPSRIRIYKVEDGDSLVGNENGLTETDLQGQTESSGGFAGKVLVNDAGDGLIYEVRGRREYLKERGDVRDIAYDPETGEWFGYVTKRFDGYSEQIVEGTENDLKAMDHVKPLYQLDGTFTGKGIRFGISISEALLSLYKGIEIEKTGENTYTGVTAAAEDGKIWEIRDTNTGTHKEIRTAGKDSGPAGLDMWDTVEVDNDPVNLYYYDLSETETRENPSTGELEVLDERGNVICCADSVTGMAYVYDDYGRMIAYTVDQEGDKELVRSIQVSENGGTKTLYPGKVSADDENGLPIYYEHGEAVLKDERWTTDGSTAPDGEAETDGAAHEIARLPFGAYILQEEGVPHRQGYVQSRYTGLLLKDTEEIQKYFLQNEFTKTAFAKIDVRTQREIQGAEMTLYAAKQGPDGQPLKDGEGNYLKGDKYAGWVSGMAYDDDGNMKYDSSGAPVPATEPHWIDHVPIGPYVLEETVCPYDQGYVQSASASVDVLETGNVQTFVMEDDFTSLDIRKYDTKNGDVLYEESEACLSLYAAEADGEGNPVYDPDDEIMTFRAATYKDGQEVAATGRLVSDAAGNRPIMKYDYTYRPIPNTLQGRFYYTEEASVRLEYLPVGSYVLVESENPRGYATADPVLLEVKDRGHLVEIQQYEMGDQPLKAEISKVHVTGGKEVNGAWLAVYPADGDTAVQEQPLVIRRPTENGGYEDVTAEWVSGSDGAYTAGDQQEGRIPDGFEPGDLRPHVIEYIPEGDYVLVERTTPYGFLQSVEIPFTIRDTQDVQRVEMVDEIPGGVLRIVKSDADDPAVKLEGAKFRLTNRTLGVICETLDTDEKGEAQFAVQPIGYMDSAGNFAPYTYVCEETEAAPGHMLTLKPYEFQFQYQDEKTEIISVEYNPANDSNRVKVDKVIGDTEEMLEGAHLEIQRLENPEEPDGGSKPGGGSGLGGGSWRTVDSWISTKQTHYSKGLEAGTYRLAETETPGEGYKLLAEPVEFVIQDGMTEIPHLVLRNYAAAVEVEKTVGTSDRLLAGARLQLIHKADGSVVAEWVSQETGGKRINGLSPGIYIIRELEAPSGYKRAADQEIEVLEENSAAQVFCFANYVRGSSGGGTSDHPEPEYVTFSKVDMDHRPLPGAEFTFYRQDGTVMGTSVSDARGIFRIRKPENGTYLFRETGAPEGYVPGDETYSFSVSGSQVVKGTYEVSNRALEVVIRKADGITGAGLAGAKLMILSLPDGGTAYEGTTGEDGSMMFRPLRPGDYKIVEEEAPEGYVKSDADYVFTVSPSGEVTGNTTVYNFKTEKKIGRITVFYKTSSLDGGVFWAVPGAGEPKLVKTGDTTPIIRYGLGLLASLLGLGICLRRRFGKKWFLFSAILLLGLGIPWNSAEAAELHMEIKAWTAEDPAGTERDPAGTERDPAGTERDPEPGFPQSKTVNGREYRLKEVKQETLGEVSVPGEPETYVVMSQPFTDSPDSHIPQLRIVTDGRSWVLSSFETVPAGIRGRSEAVSRQVAYREVDPKDGIPPAIEAEVEDPVTGSRRKVILPLQSRSIEKERWVDDFHLEAEVQAYDGELFLLGDRLLRLEEGNLPPQAGEALLEEAGLPGDSYEIQEIRWSGGAREKDGVVCRELLAAGRRKTVDCAAVYGGEAALDAISGQAIQAVYYAEGDEGDKTAERRYLICRRAVYEQCLSRKEKIRAGVAAAVCVGLMTAGGIIALRRRRNSRNRRTGGEREGGNR